MLEGLRIRDIVLAADEWCVGREQQPVCTGLIHDLPIMGEHLVRLFWAKAR